MSKEETQKVVGIVITALLAIAAVFGWFFPIERPEERAVRERIAIDAREDSYFHSGADVYVYSDDHSTQKLHIDGATGNVDAEGTGNFAGAMTFQGNLDVDGTSNLDEVDVDGVANVIVGTEHIGIPTIHSTSITYTAAAGGTGAVATIADGEVWLVHAVFWNTTTNFDCTGDDCTATVGDGNDPDGFMVLNDAAMQTTFTEATGFTAGWYGIENGSGGAYCVDDGGPFVYAPSGAAETIDWALAASGNDFSAGAATIYVVYTRIQ